MNCTLCDARIERCATCHSSSCPTSLCSRCAVAQPDAHPVTVTSTKTVTLGEPVLVSMDW